MMHEREPQGSENAKDPRFPRVSDDEEPTTVLECWTQGPDIFTGMVLTGTGAQPYDSDSC